jgi:hypothetical protein
MARVPNLLPPDYWNTLSLSKTDLEFVSNTLFEKETPLNEEELVPVLVEERIRTERQAVLVQQQAGAKGYLPKDHYQAGEVLVFPAMNWEKGKWSGCVRASILRSENLLLSRWSLRTELNGSSPPD